MHVTGHNDKIKINVCIYTVLKSLHDELSTMKKKHDQKTGMEMAGAYRNAQNKWSELCNAYIHNIKTGKWSVQACC